MKFRYQATDYTDNYWNLAEDRSLSRIVNDGDADLLLHFCPYIKDNFRVYGFMRDHPNADKPELRGCDPRTWGSPIKPKVLDDKTYSINQRR